MIRIIVRELGPENVDEGWVYQLPNHPAPLTALRLFGPYPTETEAREKAEAHARRAEDA